MIEKYWKTEAGLVAIAYLCYREKRKSHRCGYVGIDKNHPLFEVEYNDQIDCITQDMVDKTELGKKGLILAFTAACNSDDPGNLVRRSPNLLLDVHGGLTYSGYGEKGYPISSKLWWYGFDCHHITDREIEPDPKYSFYDPTATVKSLYYVINECESLAKQLVDFQNNVRQNETKLIA